MSWEGVRLRYNKYKRQLLTKYNGKKIKNREFTIISNNCWGGMIYESYGLQKQTPTVGLYFMPDDYIKFLTNLKEYVMLEIEFLNPKESKYRDVLNSDPRFGQYPIGQIKDIEIMFLHYKDENEARDKWNRRCKRIKWDKLLIKFNDQNGCNENHIRAYEQLPFKNKLFFTVKDWPVEKWNGYYKVRQCINHDFITASHEPWGKNKYVNLEVIINNL